MRFPVSSIPARYAIAHAAAPRNANAMRIGAYAPCVRWKTHPQANGKSGGRNA